VSYGVISVSLPKKKKHNLDFLLAEVLSCFISGSTTSECDWSASHRSCTYSGYRGIDRHACRDERPICHFNSDHSCQHDLISLALLNNAGCYDTLAENVRL
jgi:hypothetical protein